MKPSPFDLVVAESLDEALQALTQHGSDAQIIAGGQSLVAMLNMRLASPKVLVDINRISELSKISQAPDAWRFGAVVRQRAVEQSSDLPKAQPLLNEALPLVGHVQTRNRGTICGSLCHADPSSELPLCLLTLGGSVELQSATGKRTVAAEDFFTGLLSTAIEPDEMMIAASFPAGSTDSGYAFTEVAERHGDFALAAFAAVVTRNSIRLGVGGVVDRPVSRDWPALDEHDLTDALNDFAWDLNAQDDNHASARYRRDLVRKRGLATIRLAKERVVL